MQVGAIQLTQVDVVEQDAAAGGVPEPRGEAGDRRLARAGHPDHRDGLTTGDLEIEAGQHGPLAIGEVDCFEAKRTARVRQAHRMIGRRDRERLLEHSRELLETRDRGLEQVVELTELLHRLEEAPEVQQESRKYAGAHVSVDREPATVEEDNGRGHPAHELHARAVPGGQALRPLVGTPVAIVEMFEDLLIAGLSAKRVHRLDTTEALDKVHDHERDCVAGGPVGAFGLTAEPPGQQPQHRERAQNGKRELCIQHDEHHRDTHDREHRGDERDDAELQHVGQRLDVGGLARDHTS